MRSLKHGYSHAFSHLQTLFMTPEFRRVLYMWKYEQSEDEDEEDCIPLQLQLLFGQLQLTGLRAATTTVSTQTQLLARAASAKPASHFDFQGACSRCNFSLRAWAPGHTPVKPDPQHRGKNEVCLCLQALTKSFGWTGRESFQQHDVQELARVLFDALERSLGRTANSQLVRRSQIHALEQLQIVLRCWRVELLLCFLCCRTRFPCTLPSCPLRTYRSMHYSKGHCTTTSSARSVVTSAAALTTSWTSHWSSSPLGTFTSRVLRGLSRMHGTL